MFPIKKLMLEDARLAVYEDNREEIVTQVSAYGLQRQSIKANQVQME